MSEPSTALTLDRSPAPRTPEPPARHEASAAGEPPRGLRAAIGYCSTVGTVGLTLGALLLVVRLFGLGPAPLEPWAAWLRWWLPANAICLGFAWTGIALRKRRRSGFVAGAVTSGVLLLKWVVTGEPQSLFDTAFGVAGLLALVVAWRAMR